MIVVIQGKIGSGKTYFIVKSIKKNDFVFSIKEKIFTNFYINDKRVIQRDDIFFRDMYQNKNEVQNSLCVIDEANKIYNSRDWKRSNIYEFLTLSRKNETDIVFISQTFSSLDKSIRDLTEYVIYCRTIPFVRLFLSDLRFYTVIDPENKTLVRLGFFWIGKYAQFYDTTQVRGKEINQKIILEGKKKNTIRKILIFVLILFLLYFVATSHVAVNDKVKESSDNEVEKIFEPIVINNNDNYNGKLIYLIVGNCDRYNYFDNGMRAERLNNETVGDYMVVMDLDNFMRDYKYNNQTITSAGIEYISQKNLESMGYRVFTDYDLGYSQIKKVVN